MTLAQKITVLHEKLILKLADRMTTKLSFWREISLDIASLPV